MNFSHKFLKNIPKTDLHLHLDGSLRIPSIIEMAKDNNISLPSNTETGLRELVFKERYNNLDEYLKGFATTCSVLQNNESLERAAYELALDCFNDGVRYCEVRFAPQLHANDNFTIKDVILSVDNGLKKAKNELNKQISEDEPPFDFGLILCAMRFCNENFSQYYNNFFSLHQYSGQHETIQAASLELAKAATTIKETTDAQIVGFDIAGSEYGHPADNHRHSYYHAHQHFLMKTVHAGEAYGPESIFLAITKCYADRIGHGLFLFSTDKIKNPKIEDRQKYINDLTEYIAHRRITLEVCLTSNLQTVPEIKDYAKHPLQQMLDHNLSISLCTDNMLVSNTTVSKEIEHALSNFEISPKQLKNIIIYGFKRSFYHGTYSEKRTYVRKAIEYYEKLEKEYSINNS